MADSAYSTFMEVDQTQKRYAIRLLQVPILFILCCQLLSNNKVSRSVVSVFILNNVVILLSSIASQVKDKEFANIRPKFVNHESLLARFICNICSLILVNPYQTRCGCRYDYSSLLIDSVESHYLCGIHPVHVVAAVVCAGHFAPCSTGLNIQ